MSKLYIDTLSASERTAFLARIEADRIREHELKIREVEEQLAHSGVEYMITLRGYRGEPYYFKDAWMPEMFIPSRVLSLMLCSFVDKMLGLCKYDCPLACHCHVCVRIPQQHDIYWKFCTVLFHDAVKPQWKLEDVV